MKLKTIAVVDRNWGIGMNGGLLVHLPGDLKYFKEQTLHNIVIMGRATLESLPGGRPLPDRTTIVMTHRKDLKGDFYTADSLDSLFELLSRLLEKKPDAVPFACGGEKIYELLLPFTDECLITKIDGTFEADKHFIDLDNDSGFELTKEGIVNTENNIDYRFCKYKRIED